MVIFRENTETFTPGLSTPPARRNRKRSSIFPERISKEFDKIRFGTREKAAEFWKRVARRKKATVMVGIGVKPVSRSGSVRCDPQRDQLRDPESAHECDARGTKGNIMNSPKARSAIGAMRSRKAISAGKKSTAGRGAKFQWQTGRRLVIKGRHCRHHLATGADAAEDFDVIATLNLNAIT